MVYFLNFKRQADLQRLKLFLGLNIRWYMVFGKSSRISEKAFIPVFDLNLSD
jgi:hypothetical protein